VVNFFPRSDRNIFELSVLKEYYIIFFKLTNFCKEKTYVCKGHSYALGTKVMLFFCH
jgi:hypothetical protein